MDAALGSALQTANKERLSVRANAKQTNRADLGEDAGGPDEAYADLKRFP